MLTNSFELREMGRRLRAEIKSFDEDENGLNTVEMLLLLMIGVIVLAALVKFVLPNVWTKIIGFVKDILGLEQKTNQGL